MGWAARANPRTTLRQQAPPTAPIVPQAVRMVMRANEAAVRLGPAPLLDGWTRTELRLAIRGALARRLGRFHEAVTTFEAAAHTYDRQTLLNIARHTLEPA